MKGSTGVATDWLARALAVLGLLILVGGSTYVLLVMLGVGSDPNFPGDYVDAGGIVFFIIWPLVLLVSGLLIATGLSRTQGLAVALIFLLAIAGIYILIWRVLSFTAHVMPGNPQWGLLNPTVVLAVLLLLMVNVGAIAFTWRYIIQARM